MARPQQILNAILDIIVPVFGTVAVGWALARSRLLTTDGLRGLTNVAFYALFPALLFHSMANAVVISTGGSVLTLSLALLLLGVQAR